MTSRRAHLVDLVEQGLIPEEHIRRSLSVVGVTPDARAWRRFLDRFLLISGVLALACAVVFFIAHNWDGIGRFARFGVVQALMVVAVLGYCALDHRKLAARVLLLAAGIFLGVLLALYGQVYQTGADPWQLFLTWAAMLLPWAFIARYPPIWLLWVALVNLAIVLYHQVFRGLLWFVPGTDSGMLWLLFGFNTLCLVSWEYLSRHQSWMAGRAPPRLLAVAAGVSITLLAVNGVVEEPFPAMDTVGGWLAWLAALYFVYRRWLPDLFMLAGGCLSGIVVLVVLAARLVLDYERAGGFLVLAAVVVGLGSGAAVWLRRVHREWHP